MPPEITVGRYHDLIPEDPGPAWFRATTDTFVLESVPPGDGGDSSTFATVAGEPVNQSTSELAAVLLNWQDLESGGDVRIVWRDPDEADPLFTYGFLIPEPEQQGFDFWEWYSVYSWIGRFPGEIDEPGEYQIEIDYPTGFATRTFDVLSEPDQPAEPDTYRLPFSVLNEITPFSDIEDVVLTVPQLPDVRSVVDDLLPGWEQYRQDIIQALLRAPIGPTGITVGDVLRLIETIDQKLEDVGLDLGFDLEQTLTDIQTDIQNIDLDIVGVGYGGSELAIDVQEFLGIDAQDIAAELDDLLDIPVIDEIEAVVDDLLGPIEPMTRDISNRLFENIQPNVFDTLSNTEQLLADLSSLTGDVGELFDVVDDLDVNVEDPVRTVLNDVEPAVAGAGLFTNPIAFFVGVVFSVFEESLEEETQQRLADAAGGDDS